MLLILGTEIGWSVKNINGSELLAGSGRMTAKDFNRLARMMRCQTWELDLHIA